MRTVFNSYGNSYITKDLLIEFIQDARAKNELNLEYEITYFYPDQKIKKIVSTGTVYLNSPIDDQIMIKDKSGNDIVISSLNSDVYLFGYKIPANYACMLEVCKSGVNEKSALGILSSITLGLDHPVTISIDSNGSDWTGYLGGIILTEEEHEAFFGDTEKNGKTDKDN